MGFGKSWKRTFGKVISQVPGGEKIAGNTGIFGLSGLFADSAVDAYNRQRRAKGLPNATREQITTANLFQKLTPEQQKDLLLNNPNIETSLGNQTYDPLTNTLKLTESDYVKNQRLRQEDLARALSSSLTGNLPTTNLQEVRDATFNQGKNLLEPEFEEQRENLRQELANQGIPIGSEAYEREMDRMERSQGNQLNQLSLASVNQGIATAEAQRQARFNEISALLGQQQVGGIEFNQFKPNHSGLDLFGAEQGALNRSFQADQIRRQRKSDRDNALIGALGGLGSAGIGAAFSDIRLKENIKPVGKSKSGLTIYEFEYKNKKKYGNGRYRGAIAQNVETKKPTAIAIINGYKAVNYDLIDINFEKISNN